jgi:Raf kinase inhibitor-like YbhB/YbcL family protein
MKTLLCGALTVLMLSSLSCGGSDDRVGVKYNITLTSPAIDGKTPLDKRFTCDGKNVSPELNWEVKKADSCWFALICDDPDAPAGTWVHWVIYNIPGSARQLPEGFAKDPRFDDGTIQGRNDSGHIGYDGPCPPPGKPHHYFFKLYQLDAPVALEPGAAKAELLKAMETHVIDQGKLMAEFGR